MSSAKGDVKVPHDIALFLTILAIVSMVVGSATWVSLNPRPVEQFFALGILGANMMAEGYYPGKDTSIGPGVLVKWHVTIYNHMGSVQYVAIRAKLLNGTTLPPDSMNSTPSTAPYFREIRRVLVDNETWIFPFYWSVEGVSRSNDSLRIAALKLNNITIAEGLNTTALNGINFRIILELWTYANESASFQYGWRSGGELRSAWVQIWFNLTAPATVENQSAGAVVEIHGRPVLASYAGTQDMHAAFSTVPVCTTFERITSSRIGWNLNLARSGMQPNPSLSRTRALDIFLIRFDIH